MARDTVHDYIEDMLTTIVETVQSGKAGVPTIKDLQVCGEIHAILERERG